MPIIRRPLRYAHSTGKTDVCYSKDGKKILTCGADGDVRIWLSVEDDDPTSICAGDSAQSVLNTDDNNLLVANDAFLVQILTFNEGDPVGILTQFTGIVTHMAFDPDRKIVAAGSEDMTVKVINSNDKTVLATLTDFAGPILGVALNHNGTMVAASCGDGSLNVYQVDTSVLLKKIECVPNVKNYNSAEILCRSSFDPISGKYFAYTDFSEVIVLDTITWGKYHVFTESSAKGPFSICGFSPCGGYLAAATCKGCICVWHLESKKLVGYTPHPNKHGICSMAWNPKGNGELAYCDISGQLGAVEGCNLPAESSKLEINENKDLENLVKKGFDNSDDEDDDNVISLEKLKNSTLGNLEDEDNKSERASSRASSIALPTATITPLQPPFQCGSTPIHLSERYLVWNETGIIRSLGTDEENSIIDITFHDMSVHNSMHLRNRQNHSLGALSSKIVALSNKESPCLLTCVALEGNKEFSYEMPDNEEIICLTASDNYVGVVTDLRLLRIFTIWGTQRDVICIPGPVVTTAAHLETFLVAYHAGAGEDQNIMIMVINLKRTNVASTEIRLPLSPGAKLTWLGFTDLLSFASYDSTGILRIFDPKASLWRPAYNYAVKRTGISDGLFIISVNETEQSFDAIVCRGSIYPSIAPKPLVGTFKLGISMCDPDSDKSILEDQFIRCLQSSEKKMVKPIFETALKLFAEACTNENDKAAYEITNIMASYSKFVEITRQYANRKGRPLLAEKISELIDHTDLFESEASQENPVISEIKNNPVEILNSVLEIQVRSSTTENLEPVIQPLKIKQGQNNRVQVCKIATEEGGGESQETTPKSLFKLVADPNSESNTPKNPFSKVGKLCSNRNPDPFSVNGAIERLKSAKRKVEEVVEKESKQRKLDSFKFSRNSETQD